MAMPGGGALERRVAQDRPERMNGMPFPPWIDRGGEHGKVCHDRGAIAWEGAVRGDRHGRRLTYTACDE